MKKVAAVALISLSLFVGASAFATSTSLIGQKVQGLFSIEQGGKKVADAVIINGVAYAPVRAVAEATGTSLTVEGKKIIMETESVTSSSTVSPADPSSTAASSTVNMDALKNERELVQYEITKRESYIKGTEEETIPFHEKLAKELANNGTLGQQHQDAVTSLKNEVEKMKSELVTLKQQLAELDAQIAALQQ